MLRRLLSIAVILVLAAMGPLSVLTLPSASAATSHVVGLVKGSAWGYSGLIKQSTSTVSNGPVAIAETGCDSKPFSQTASVGAVKYPQYAATGNVNDKVVTTHTAGALTVTSTDTVNKANLAGGLVSATMLSATATSTGTASNSISSLSIHFDSLVVDGRKYAETVKPGTKETLPGLGYVILNEQNVHAKGANSSDASVNLIDLYVTKHNSYGLLPGSRIIVGHANSAFDRTQTEYVLHAQAYGYAKTSGVNGAKVSSGEAAFVEVGCTAGSQSNHVSQLKSAEATTQTIADSAHGKEMSTGAIARASSIVKNAALLSKLVTADTIKVTATTVSNKSVVTHTGTTLFANLAIAGIPVKDSPPANTRVNIPGVGFAIVNEQKWDPKTNTEAVNGLNIKVTMKNGSGVPVGSDIIVAHAKTSTAKA